MSAHEALRGVRVDAQVAQRAHDARAGGGQHRRAVHAQLLLEREQQPLRRARARECFPRTRARAQLRQPRGRLLRARGSHVEKTGVSARWAASAR